jgi:hypothetical protein
LGLEYEVQYKRGADNIVADALSRRAVPELIGEVEALSEILPSWIEELNTSYNVDEWAAAMHS